MNLRISPLAFIKNNVKRKAKRVSALLKVGILLFLATIIALFIIDFVTHMTSSSAVLYFVRGESGLFEVKNDLSFDESDRLLFMINASPIVEKYFEGRATARGVAVLETTWDEKEGRGVIKEYRTDGTKFSVTLSRYKDPEGIPQGLFIGGDLPYGDIDRDKTRNNSGIAHYDGDIWHHIWCAMNEGFTIRGIEKVFFPEHWKYVGSSVLKDASDEVIIESRHELKVNEKRIKMIRTVSKEAGTDFVLLKIKFVNESASPLTFNYSIGDEPWLGDYASSSGDVGWIEGKLIQYETFISPVKNRYAGFFDIGNDVIGEKAGYYGVANFIEWVNSTPSLVYFSNDFDFETIDEERPLDSYNNRIINLSWIQKDLFPRDSMTFVLALGMASVNAETGIPEKPVVGAKDMYRME